MARPVPLRTTCPMPLRRSALDRRPSEWKLFFSPPTFHRLLIAFARTLELGLESVGLAPMLGVECLALLEQLCLAPVEFCTLAGGAGFELPSTASARSSLSRPGRGLGARRRLGGGSALAEASAFARLALPVVRPAARKCSARLPRERLMTSPGDASGCAVSSGSVTSSALPEAKRSLSAPHASSAALRLGAAT